MRTFLGSKEQIETTLYSRVATWIFHPLSVPAFYKFPTAFHSRTAGYPNSIYLIIPEKNFYRDKQYIQNLSFLILYQKSVFKRALTGRCVL